MGLFDLTAPLYSALDNLLAFLPPLARLLFWAAVTAVISMALYWLCSGQEKVEAAKTRAIEARRTMAAYDGTEMDEMLPLAKESLAASGKHFIIVLGPAVLSSLPALTLIVWVSNHFSYELPTTGESITISSAPDGFPGGIEPASAKDGSYTLTYPDSDAAFVMRSTDGIELASLPLKKAVPIVHKRAWWNSLIANPNGYIPAAAEVDEIRFELRKIEYLSIGPGWMHTWEFSYFLLLIVTSLGIKVAFKIH